MILLFWLLIDRFGGEKDEIHLGKKEGHIHRCGSGT